MAVYNLPGAAATARRVEVKLTGAPPRQFDEPRQATSEPPIAMLKRLAPSQW